MMLMTPSAGRALLRTAPNSVAGLQRASLTVRPQIQHALRCMSVSGKTDAKLDKNTPEDVWKNILSAEEYYVLREKGTERPFSENYKKFYEEGDGVYVCSGCGTPLYKSETKFQAGCGWPALYEEIPGTVDRHTDTTMGMSRTEITCSNCGGHLGHEFLGEGFPTPTNSRHCVNSVSIKFKGQE